MSCNPNPIVTCGDTNFDTCIIYTGTFPTCLPGGKDCYRQSDFNSQVGTLLCSINTSVDLENVALPVDCTLSAPPNTTVATEFQDVYNKLCAINASVTSLTTNLSLPLGTGIDLKCLVNPCGDPIATLGDLLEILILYACASDASGAYTATLQQSGTTAPVDTRLVTTLDPTFSYLTWSYVSTGVYELTASGPLAGTFAQGRVSILIGSAQNFTNQIIAYRLNTSKIRVSTATSGSVANDILNETTIHIKVY